MATVRVISQPADTGGSETEEFYAEAKTLDLVAMILLDHERKVASIGGEEWLVWVEFHIDFYFNPAGFSFTITDCGPGINYRYVFTA